MAKKKLLYSVPIVVLLCLCVFEYMFFNTKLSEMKNESAPVSVQSEPDVVHFDNANSRDTYFTIHNVKEAQQISTGKGIKVGILDHSFATQNHKDLYAGGEDFTGNPGLLYTEEWHGYWMACVLREIAPECDIYALCTYNSSEDVKANNMAKAIDWAIENDIDILTYSAEPFSAEENKAKIDAAVDKATANGIVTTFIHYDNPNNIWPTGFAPLNNERMSRDADLNIFPYDYNTLFVKDYITYSEGTDDIQSIPPYMSISSTSPVTAGFVALLKSVNNSLKPSEYKDILINTSHTLDCDDSFMNRRMTSPRIVDIKKALDYMTENDS